MEKLEKPTVAPKTLNTREAGLGVRSRGGSLCISEVMRWVLLELCFY